MDHFLKRGTALISTVLRILAAQEEVGGESGAEAAPESRQPREAQIRDRERATCQWATRMEV